MSSEATLRIALVAEEGAGLAMFQRLARGAHAIAAVLTSPLRAGREGALWRAARERGCDVLPARAVKDPSLADRLRAAEVDLLLNVHSLYVIEPRVLDAPRIGSFNLHPGPLPRYAGRNAPSWAIWRGERRHGVTVHRMSAGIDTGPIAYQSCFELAEDETALTLSVRCAHEGLALMSRLVDDAARDPACIPSAPQDASQREYFGRERPAGGRVPWARSAAEVARMIRAFDFGMFPSPIGRPSTRRGALEVAVVKGAALEGRGARRGAPGEVLRELDRGGVEVACGEGSVRVERVAVEERRVAPREVMAPGDVLGP